MAPKHQRRGCYTPDAAAPAVRCIFPCRRGQETCGEGRVMAEFHRYPLRVEQSKRRINARSSASTCGRPPNERDFQRQYRRKPARCQRTSVSGRMTAMTFRTDGNHRYSWIKNMRSRSECDWRLSLLIRVTGSWRNSRSRRLPL
jgi:hypothetical protein